MIFKTNQQLNTALEIILDEIAPLNARITKAIKKEESKIIKKYRPVLEKVCKEINKHETAVHKLKREHGFYVNRYEPQLRELSDRDILEYKPAAEAVKGNEKLSKLQKIGRDSVKREIMLAPSMEVNALIKHVVKVMEEKYGKC